MKKEKRNKHDSEIEFASELRIGIQFLYNDLERFIEEYKSEKDIPKSLYNAFDAAKRLKTVLMENTFKIELCSNHYTFPIWDNSTKTIKFDSNGEEICED
jgi:hypothetical protein